MRKRLAVSSSTSSAAMRRFPALTLIALLTLAPAATGQTVDPPELVQARQLFDALEYEQALPLLDRAVGVLELQASRDPGARPSLTAAYGMRARARFGIGNKDGATSDFRSALSIDPAFSL